MLNLAQGLSSRGYSVHLVLAQAVGSLLDQVPADVRVIDLHALLVGPDGLLPADMTGDGLHFNQIGYERWAEAAGASAAPACSSRGSVRIGR